MNRVGSAGDPTSSSHPRRDKHFYMTNDANNIKTEEVFVDASMLPLMDHHMSPTQENPPKDVNVIELSSSSGEFTDWENDDVGEEVEKDEGGMMHSRHSKSNIHRSSSKRLRMTIAKEELPLGFLDPLPPAEEDEFLLPPLAVAMPHPVVMPFKKVSKQFWKAGDFDEDLKTSYTAPSAAGMDHVRVHPKFLHSNATSHKWALGALAELLDNSFDEVCNGATYVSIDMIENKKDGSRMLLIEDNGGGMDPEKIRQCMSLGYSAKSKIANTIGQYGNGFKTSTMRLGADVIVFSRTRGKEGRRSTQSIGMLSYTFLMDTGKEDTMVPMLDYEKDREDRDWKNIFRSSSIDWSANLETIIKWSPYSTEKDLLQQFSSMKDQGTRVVIYNLWEDDQGELELDFDADKYDIQIRGVNRDEKKIEMAKQFPNSRHFLTYRHSLRSYASILYLRLPHNFKMILRGKDIEHHNIVNDMMIKQEVTYKPQSGPDVPKDPNMVAVVTIGFVKDAKGHIDVQGFNVYHKNRLIKPFWRVWNAAGSDGRGVLGVLEANFVEPAHDKQDFERTTILSRLESKLIQMQKTYWSSNCHRIGYAPRRNKKHLVREDKESLTEVPAHHHRIVSSPCSAPHIGKSPIKDKNAIDRLGKIGSLPASSKLCNRKGLFSSRDNDINITSKLGGNRGSEGYQTMNSSPVIDHVATRSHSKETISNCDKRNHIVEECEPNIELNNENKGLKKRIHELELELQQEREQNKLLNDELQEMKIKLDEADKEQEALIDVFSEERKRRSAEEEDLRNKLKEALHTIQELHSER